MILVDDGLAMRALAGADDTYWTGETPAVPWFFYLRLLIALRGSRPPGRLSNLATPQMIEYASAPPAEVLRVLDPRPYTHLTADLLNRRQPGINKLSADFLAAAIYHESAVHVIAGNVGRNWGDLCDMLGVELRIVPAATSP